MLECAEVMVSTSCSLSFFNDALSINRARTATCQPKCRQHIWHLTFPKSACLHARLVQASSVGWNHGLHLPLLPTRRTETLQIRFVKRFNAFCKVPQPLPEPGRRLCNRA